jgi:hypothetical protein
MHFIHAKRITETPWGWRDAVVCRVEAQVVRVRCLEPNHEVTLWHHRGLAVELPAGSPVRLHVGYHALGWPAGWVNVRLDECGLGPVPPPEDPEAWRTAQGHTRRQIAVVDLSDGRAVAVDHHPPGHPDGRGDE